MNKFILLLALLTTAFFQRANAQTSNYYVSGDSLVGCQNSLTIWVTCGTTADDGYVSINWGDGNTQTYPYSLTGNDYEEIIAPHVYSVPGVYDAHIDVYSNTLGANIDAGADRQLTGLSQTSCGWFYGSVNDQSNAVAPVGAIMDCTDANGQVTSVSQNYLYYGQFSGLNPANAPYTVSLNDQWLTDHGLYQITSDQTITSFDVNGMANTQIHFEVTCNSPNNEPDFTILNLWTSDFVAVNQAGTLGLVIANQVCSGPVTPQVSITFPADFTPITTNLTNPSVVGNTLTFTVGASSIWYEWIGFSFPGGTPAGTPFCFDVNVIHANELNPSDNNGTICGTILNSYDPNNKEVNLPQQIDPDVQEELTYTIHFQNDGNYSAANVTLVDTISENLDMSTFKLITSKHGVSANINTITRVVTFTFNNIMLAPSSQNLDASQGFVTYSIQEVVGLQEGDEIENTAYIYFDYNPAIVTNTTYNINTSLGITNEQQESLVLYPNPAQNTVSVLHKGLEHVVIMDITGKEVLTADLTDNNQIDISHLSNGMYTCVFTGINGIAQEQLVIRR